MSISEINELVADRYIQNIWKLKNNSRYLCVIQQTTTVEIKTTKLKKMKMSSSKSLYSVLLRIRPFFDCVKLTYRCKTLSYWKNVTFLISWKCDHLLNLWPFLKSSVSRKQPLLQLNFHSHQVTHFQKCIQLQWPW